jgi:hypothetical protein
MSNELTENEERIGFYYELGLAITAWAHVEQSLCWLVMACFTKHNTIQTAHGFFPSPISGQNFNLLIVSSRPALAAKAYEKVGGTL